DACQDHDPLRPIPGCRIGAQPLERLVLVEPQSLARIALQVSQSHSDEETRTFSRLRQNPRIDRGKSPLPVGLHREHPGVVLGSALDVIKTARPLRVAVVKGRSKRVADRDEGVGNERVSQKPRSDTEKKTENSRGGEMRAGTPWIATIPDGRGQQRREQQRRRARKGRQAKESAGEHCEVGRWAVGGSEQQEGSREKKRKKKRLAL